jgi:hypothetical protein
LRQRHRGHALGGPADHLGEVVDDGGHGQVLDRGRVGVEGLDLEAWVGRARGSPAARSGPSSAPSCAGSPGSRGSGRWCRGSLVLSVLLE